MKEDSFDDRKQRMMTKTRNRNFNPNDHMVKRSCSSMYLIANCVTSTARVDNRVVAPLARS